MHLAILSDDPDTRITIWRICLGRPMNTNEYESLKRRGPDHTKCVSLPPTPLLPLEVAKFTLVRLTMSSSPQGEKDKSSNYSLDRDIPPASLSYDGEDEAHRGVHKVEAIHRVFGRYSKWALFISLGLAAYIYSLDGTTTYNYLSFATSGFGHHSLISSIQVAQSVIVAVGKPVIARIADVSSRGTAYVFVLLFYVIGYIVIASAQNVGAIAAGIVIYAIGYTGLQLLTQVIIADITTLKWRGLVSALMSTPFIINAFVGSNISTNILQNAGWRWGYGMFAILVPAALSPLIVTLLWAEWKARKQGLIEKNTQTADMKWYMRVRRMAAQLDLIGLALLGTSVALILLPLTLSENAKGHWKNASMIAMIVIGGVLIPVFFMYDWKLAKYPVVPARLLKNRSVVGASLIGFFDFVSFYLTFTYLFSFVIVVKPWPLLHATYFSQTQTVALTFFGICAGFAMRFIHRYKYVLVVGLCIRLVGVGLMIHSRGANASDAEVVWTQILQGIGGGFAAVSLQVGAQASVPHVDVAMVTAVVLLITEIGGAVGSAVAGAIWTNTMPGKISQYLPFLPEADRQQLFGSIVYAASFPRGHPVREGVIAAYSDVMETMLIVATVLSVFPIFIALAMPNWHLGDKQNAVDDKNLAGEPTLAGQQEQQKS
ncbi:drug:h+ antiporter [Pleurotus eryngii]|uniref:Drug:h+ antiporter n=1 Tax=Pleurotus eryngii TaxID=5323 RepID=A0A9P6DBW8_PLEER|nr:drug:h+ antiporter [Pleurotus eryngii]